jgi:hypothetical protein
MKSGGVRTRSQIANIGVRTRSNSLKGGSGSNTKDDPSDKSSSRGEKWTIRETEALLDAYEQNYVKSERPNYGKQQLEHYVEEVNNRSGRPKSALLRDPKQCKTKMDSL